MKKFRNSIVAAFLIAGLLITIHVKKSSANAGDENSISGKVVYSDNDVPVSGGCVKVFRSNDGNSGETILETVQISTAGTFRISGQYASDFGIKIMAYPNDYDGHSPAFQPEVMELGKLITVNSEEHIIKIDVKRISDANTSESRDSDFRIRMGQNFPNPFNPATSIKFEVTKSSPVTLKIYNMNGELIATLLDNKYMAAGVSSIEFNAGDLPSGIYVYSLKAGGLTLNRKMILLK